jgi:hypothetical protein
MEEELMYTPNKRGSMLSFYASGAIAGVVSIAVSHPADTVKVKYKCSIPVF